MAMAMADRPQAQRGYALLPSISDRDLITFVLHPMVARQQQGFDAGGGFVHLADVYSVAPERLAERYAPAPGSSTACWYFICPARCRYRAAGAGALGEGRWNSETGGEVVSPVRGADGRRVGHSRTLSYYSYGGAGRTTPPPWTTVTRHGWCMVELALDDDDEHDGGGGVGGGFVLCKLFRSPHNEVAVPARAPLFNCKRKAVGDHTEAPPSVRQQQLVQHSF